MNSSSLWENKYFENEAQKKQLEKLFEDIEIRNLKLEFPKTWNLWFFKTLKYNRDMDLEHKNFLKTYWKTLLKVGILSLKNLGKNSPKTPFI